LHGLKKTPTVTRRDSSQASKIEQLMMPRTLIEPRWQGLHGGDGLDAIIRHV
jgi:hypothetical protein